MTAAGVDTPPETPDQQERGRLDGGPDPTPGTQLDEAYAGLTWLKKSATEPTRLLAETLDLASSRWDAWVTSLATRRLAQVRTAGTTGVVVGAYGWLDGLVGRAPLQPAAKFDYGRPAGLVTDLANGGHLHAPSVAQAVTAAILRSGQLSHRAPTARADDPGPLAVDLSARRVRIAESLLAQVHQGQSLGVLLGYRFERALQEAGLGARIAPLRRALRRALAPLDKGAPTDVVDGLALARLRHRDPGAGQTADINPALDEFDEAIDELGQFKEALDALDDLDEALDAVADALLAEGVHHTLQGRNARAGAALGAAARGDLTVPDLEFVRTRRPGRAFTQRLLIGAPEKAANVWPQTPRSMAEPALDRWVGNQFGDPKQIFARVAGHEPVTLSGLGLGALDLIVVASRTAELEQYIAAKLGVPDGSLLPVEHYQRSLIDILQLARAIAALITLARPMDGRDLAKPSATDPSADLNELSTRVAGARTRLKDAAAALRPEADDAAWDAALLGLWFMGVAGAVPGADQDRAALNATARAEVQSRLEKCDTLTYQAVHGEPAGRLAALLEQMRVLHGEGFVALPRVKLENPDIVQPASGTTTADGAALEVWLAQMGRVRPGVAALATMRTCSELLAGGLSPMRPLAIVPALPAGASWIGLPTAPGTPAGATTSLVFIGNAPTPAPADPTLAGLVVDEWTETVPDADVTTGLTFHFDAPGEQAPQSILLAVPPAPDKERWTLEDLEAAVLQAADVAQARAADPADIAALLPFLPAVHITGGVTAPQLFDPPLAYGVTHTPGGPAITRIDGQRDLVQGASAAQLTVFGSNLADAEWSLIGTGVALTSPPSTSASGATLTVRVDADAKPGQRLVHVETQAGRTQAAVTVFPEPRIALVAPSVFQRAGHETRVDVTVTGQAFPAFTGGTIQTVHGTASGVTVTIQPGGTATSVDLVLTVHATPPPAQGVRPAKPSGRDEIKTVQLVLSLTGGGMTLSASDLTLYERTE